MRLPQQLLPADVPTTLCAPPAWASPARARGRQLRCARTGQRALASIAARTALEGCSELARHRALEASRAHPLFADPYAEALSTQVRVGQPTMRPCSLICMMTGLCSSTAQGCSSLAHRCGPRAQRPSNQGLKPGPVCTAPLPHRLHSCGSLMRWPLHTTPLPRATWMSS